MEIPGGAVAGGLGRTCENGVFANDIGVPIDVVVAICGGFCPGLFTTRSG